MMSMVPRTYVQNSPIDLYNMLDDLFSTPSNSKLIPAFRVDISENDQGYTIEADLPGVDKNQLDIELADETLTIGVEYNQEREEQNEHGEYIHRERQYASMKRSARLKDADADAIQAKLDNGILTVSVPKRQRNDGARKICIE